MFIKKYVKADKTYYILVIVEQKKKDKKPHFINCFINEKLAEVLSKLGVEVKSNEND